MEFWWRKAQCADAVVPNLEVRPQDKSEQDDGTEKKNILLPQKVI